MSVAVEIEPNAVSVSLTTDQISVNPGSPNATTVNVSPNNILVISSPSAPSVTVSS